jgi:hypothetical protein
MIYDYEVIKAVAKDRKMKVSDLLALSPNNDPFYMGTPATLAAGEWFADIYERAGYSEDRPPHLRRVHYWTVSQEDPVETPVIDKDSGLPMVYGNTERSWDYLITAAKAARYLGLVPMAGIVDNKNPPANVGADYDFQEPGARLYTPDLEKPHVWIDGIRNANAQPYHLEIWCEKSTMNDVLFPVCQRYNANLVTFEGEVSITSVCVSLLGRIKASQSKPTRIFYVSDFDPAGNSMPVAMSRKLEYAVRSDEDDDYLDIKVLPIALTPDLVRQYKLPRIPIKDSEKRGASVEANFGAGAVELDALEALYPGTLANIAASHLSRYYSREAEMRALTAERDLRAEVARQVEAITSRYQTEIASVTTMLSELRALQIDASSYAVEPEAPEVADWDTNWLYDSERDYVDQLTYYRAHKGKS